MSVISDVGNCVDKLQLLSTKSVCRAGGSCRKQALITLVSESASQSSHETLKEIDMVLVFN